MLPMSNLLISRATDADLLLPSSEISTEAEDAEFGLGHFGIYEAETGKEHGRDGKPPPAAAAFPYQQFPVERIVVRSGLGIVGCHANDYLTVRAMTSEAMIEHALTMVEITDSL